MVILDLLLPWWVSMECNHLINSNTILLVNAISLECQIFFVRKCMTYNYTTINKLIQVLVRIFCSLCSKHCMYVLLAAYPLKVTRLFSVVMGNSKLRKHLRRSGSLLMWRPLEWSWRGQQEHSPHCNCQCITKWEPWQGICDDIFLDKVIEYGGTILFHVWMSV